MSNVKDRIALDSHPKDLPNETDQLLMATVRSRSHNKTTTRV